MRTSSLMTITSHVLTKIKHTHRHNPLFNFEQEKHHMRWWLKSASNQPFFTFHDPEFPLLIDRLIDWSTYLSTYLYKLLIYSLFTKNPFPEELYVQDSLKFLPYLDSSMFQCLSLLFMKNKTCLLMDWYNW